MVLRSLYVQDTPPENQVEVTMLNALAATTAQVECWQLRAG